MPRSSSPHMTSPPFKLTYMASLYVVNCAWERRNVPSTAMVAIELSGEKLALEDRGSPPPPEVKGIYITGNGLQAFMGQALENEAGRASPRPTR